VVTLAVRYGAGQYFHARPRQQKHRLLLEFPPQESRSLMMSQLKLPLLLPLLQQ
jgi:hypothetical protein